MVKVKVDERGKNKKIVNYLQIKFNKLPSSAIYKALRNKDIKVNQIRIKDNINLEIGDEIEVYIKDDIIYGKTTCIDIDKNKICYEDENILVYDKPINIEVQGQNGEIGLEEAIKKEYNISYFKACHRLDRNTRGLVIFAKNKESESNMLEMIKNRYITKYYKTIVYKKNAIKKEDTLIDYLWKDSKKSYVIISDICKKGYQKIITSYKIIKNIGDLALLRVELITGKTHQIRAHLAFVGCPILGDEKYGIHEINQKFHQSKQQLCASEIIIKKGIGSLEYLTNLNIKISDKNLFNLLNEF